MDRQDRNLAASKVFWARVLRRSEWLVDEGLVDVARVAALRRKDGKKARRKIVSKAAAEYLVEALEKAGVKRVYGVVGDSLNGFTDSMRRRKSID